MTEEPRKARLDLRRHVMRLAAVDGYETVTGITEDVALKLIRQIPREGLDVRIEVDAGDPEWLVFNWGSARHMDHLMIRVRGYRIEWYLECYKHSAQGAGIFTLSIPWFVEALMVAYARRVSEYPEQG